MLLFDSKGELFVQKRNPKKAHNPSLFDKSIGGHISFGDRPNYTAMVETVQELQIPSVITVDSIDFVKTLTLLKNFTDRVSILLPMDECFGEIIIQEKQINGVVLTIASKVYMYFGIYTGAVQTVDKEAKGAILYNMDDLKAEIKANPHQFTNDLNYYIHYYSDEIDKFLTTVKNI